MLRHTRDDVAQDEVEADIEDGQVDVLAVDGGRPLGRREGAHLT